ncbi:transmembrane protease serine 12-like isoform X2 [Pollicipes pollicipes]|uniref:transmembrane protease serine 12-like isoform X1 n=1 Tax=Pollicipes pollicipes TaxID=41117 RepID=UPI0018859048|nr:transmembrane protease serine 12-like isoform X1 [Pollicipes pollicipes]XP_037080622.1 transmembrane protease serine 12-like isoform X2 [Pollicipes pollicipes]
MAPRADAPLALCVLLLAQRTLAARHDEVHRAQPVVSDPQQDANSQFHSPVASDDALQGGRHTRQAATGRDEFVCPDPSVSDQSCSGGSVFDCRKKQAVCELYRLAFTPVPNTRSSGQVTWSGVSLDTCATRCARAAPACRHFSFRDRQCILGCRGGSSGCVKSGELIKDFSWTYYFLDARKLATITRRVLLKLKDEAASNKINDIIGRLGPSPEDSVSRAAGESVQRLFTSELGSTALIANGQVDSLPVDCGRRPLAGIPGLVPFVTGGEPATPGQYPWQARILVFEGGSAKHQCGGVVITSRHVLTAAHCLRAVGIAETTVTVGENNLDVRGSSKQEFIAENFQFHQFYGKGPGPLGKTQYWNDLMLVKLSKAIEFNNVVQPACLPLPGLFESDLYARCNVSGWGKTEERETVSSVLLRGVSTPLVSNEYCLAPEVYGASFNPDIMFCAGNLDPSMPADACQGDSGGPLTCELPISEQDFTERFAVYGVVSHGHLKGCGEEPGVYTKVEYFTNWILDTIRKLN